jgi:hypothetical protein
MATAALVKRGKYSVNGGKGAVKVKVPAIVRAVWILSLR